MSGRTFTSRASSMFGVLFWVPRNLIFFQCYLATRPSRYSNVNRVTFFEKWFIKSGWNHHRASRGVVRLNTSVMDCLQVGRRWTTPNRRITAVLECLLYPRVKPHTHQYIQTCPANEQKMRILVVAPACREMRSRKWRSSQVIIHVVSVQGN